MPVALSRRSALAILAEEAFPFFSVNFVGKNPLDAGATSLAKIPFVIAASFFGLHLDCKQHNGH
jgi:hypothetical protein